MSVGESPFGVEPPEKGMGVAGHTAANAMPQALTAHIVHSTIAHGAVLHMDVSGALNVPGVVRILTCFDVPDRPFPAGGPWLAREARQERTERLLLNRHVRVWGDEIAVVLAQSESAARRAAALIEVEYERFPILMTPEAAMAKEAPAIHEQYPDNVLSHSSYVMGTGTYQETATSGGLIRLEKSYRTQTTRHCPAEPGGCLAYREHDCVVVITDTPIPNLVHHVIAQATGLAWGSIQIIKPENGVGLHHQQRVIYEPLAAWLTIQMGGRPVRLELSREEAFMGTRTCHAVDFTLCAAVHADGRLAARRLEAWSHQGGYAPSGHSIARNAAAGY
ncbi:MAG: molybdopterin cofactor-binding domain-containing protein, partial [Oscillospiraceae bacterium]